MDSRNALFTCVHVRDHWGFVPFTVHKFEKELFALSTLCSAALCSADRFLEFHSCGASFIFC
jgi:hypothetical protein